MPSPPPTLPNGEIDIDAIMRRTDELLKDFDERRGRVGQVPAGGWDSWESMPWHNNSQAIQNIPSNEATGYMSGQNAYNEALYQRKCNTCNNLDPRGHPFSSRIETTDNAIKAKLELHNIDSNNRYSPEAQCGYCALIAAAFKKFHPRWSLTVILDDSIPILPKIESITLVENEPILLTVGAWPDGKYTRHGIELFRDLGDVVPGLPLIGAAGGISDRSDSDACFAFIRKNIEHCIGNHPDCQTKPTSLPKRVLDLGTYPQNSFPPAIRLLETDGKLKDRYAALSHCWGNGKIPRLLVRGADGKTDDGIEKYTAGNINQLKEAIDFSTLSETFKDAIRVCNKLKIQYIWIDSLCIIQNDPEDWKDEAAKMGNIYKDAFITIAGVSSSSGDIPFLKARPPNVQRIETVPFYGPQKKSTLSKAFRSLTHPPETIYARQTTRAATGHKDNSASDAFIDTENYIVSGPLSTRAWCLQERALSTRIIHFTDEGVKWECRSAFQSEDSRSCPRSYLNKWVELEAKESRSDFRWQLQCFWRKLLMDYTSRQIKFRSDLQPALAGVAARMKKLNGSQYFAGLWKDRMMEDLCWQAGGNSWKPTGPIEESDKGMPTWSWLSMKHHVSYAVIDEPGTFIPYTSVAKFPDLPDDQFFDLPTGPLVLRGPVLHGQVSHSRARVDQSGIIMTNLTCGNHSNLFNADSWLVEADCTTETGQKMKTVRRATTEDKKDYVKVDVIVMYIGQWKSYKQPWLTELNVGLDLNFVMALARSSTVRGAYERVGLLNEVYYDSTDTWRTAEVMDISVV